jgi:hypothetical protein
MEDARVLDPGVALFQREPHRRIRTLHLVVETTLHQHAVVLPPLCSRVPLPLAYVRMLTPGQRRAPIAKLRVVLHPVAARHDFYRPLLDGGVARCELQTHRVRMNFVSGSGRSTNAGKS